MVVSEKHTFLVYQCKWRCRPYPVKLCLECVTLCLYRCQAAKFGGGCFAHRCIIRVTPPVFNPMEVKFFSQLQCLAHFCPFIARMADAQSSVPMAQLLLELEW